MTFVRLRYTAPDLYEEGMEVLTLVCESGNGSVEDYDVSDFQW